MVPQHLRFPEPHAGAHLYGSVEYDDEQSAFIITAEPCVIEACKRLFPGSASRRVGAGRARIPATQRAMGDLNWLLLRYPLRIETPEAYALHHTRAVEHAQRRERMNELPEVEVPPSFRGDLLLFQEKALRFLLANDAALLAMDVGLGKTVIALAGIAAARAWPALVVVQTTGAGNMLRQWQEQIGVFLDLPVGQRTLDAGEETPKARGKRLAHIIHGRKPYALPRAPIYLAHYDLLRDWKDALLALDLRVVVWDETQNLRHTKTERYSSASLLSDAAPRRWGLTATPIHNYGDEIWSVMNVIERHCLADKESFTREWCDGYHGRIVKDPTLLGDYLRREGLMWRARADDPDVALQLPPVRRVVQEVEHDEGVFARVLASALAHADEYELTKDFVKKGQLVRLIDTETRQACGAAKAPYAAAFIDGLLEAGDRVVAYAHHHVVHQTLLSRLHKWQPARITGLETDAEKAESKRRFVEGETPLLILALRGGAGLDGLQKQGNCVVFAELDWSPAIHTQAEGRLRRMGIDQSIDKILSYYLVADTGIDETIRDALGLKVGQFIGIMGDGRETEGDRALAQRDAENHLERVLAALRQRAPRQEVEVA